MLGLCIFCRMVFSAGALGTVSKRFRLRGLLYVGSWEQMCSDNRCLALGSSTTSVSANTFRQSLPVEIY